MGGFPSAFNLPMNGFHNGLNNFQLFPENQTMNDFIKAFKSTKMWQCPTATMHDPMRSFSATASIIFTGKIHPSQRNTDQKTTHRHHFNKVMMEFNYREMHPGIP